MQKLFCVFLFLSTSLWGGVKEDVRAFVESLSQEQKTILKGFFRILVKDSFSGYVLFGDKPMCIEACPLTTESGALCGIDEKIPFLIKGFELWQAFNISQYEKDYCFIIFDVEEYGYRHLVCINRKVFIKVVNENLSLFRYVLGPTLTAEGLLKELIGTKEQFYQILKHDNVLLGILLGYGTQNALLISRKESISDAFTSDHHENFPFLPKAVAQSKKPSIGFGSIANEYKAIKTLTASSRKLKSFDSYKIPCFGCEPNSSESKALLAMYEMNRSNIIKAVESEDFLERTLLKLLVTSSGQLEIPNVSEIQLPSLPNNRNEIADKLAGIIHQEMKEEKHFRENFAQSFIQGVRDSERGVHDIESPQEIGRKKWEIYLTEKDLEQAENLEKTVVFFHRLSNEKGISCLVPNKVYFKILQSGKGSLATLRMKDVTLHYSFCVFEEKETAGTVKSESIEQFIPGVAQALIGMKRGEIRELYIHPEYGYGTDSYLPPNLPIIAKIELVDFEEGNHEAILSAPHKIEVKNYKEISAKYEKLQNDQIYTNGINFWEFIKKRKGLIDFATFEKYFNKKHQDMPFFNKAMQNKFLSDLEWWILSLQVEK